MNSKPKISKDKPQMQLICDVSSEEHTPSEENNFPQEQISFDFTPFGDQPIVTIEYDDSDNQLDPLAVDDTVDITNLVSRANEKNKINIYHPFAQQVEELSELPQSSCPDSFYQCSPSEVTRRGLKRVEPQYGHSDQEEVVVVSDDDVYVNLCPESGRKAVQSEAAGTQTAFPNDNKGEYVDENIQSKSLLVDQLDDVVCVEDDPSNILMKELAEQMLQKIEERKLAANHLKRKRLAETTFAKKLVQQMRKPGNELVQNSPKSVDHATKMALKQQKDAESAIARRLVQQMSKSRSLEEAIVALGSITQSSRLSPASGINRANQANAGKPVARATVKGTTTQGPPDIVGPQQMEAQPHGRVPCFASWPAKRLNQSMSKGDRNIETTMPWIEASSSNPSTLQQELPSYAVAFNRPNRCNSKSSANESFVEGLGDQSFPMSNTYRSFSPQALPSYFPISAHRTSPQCSSQPPPPRASERPSLSAVHPSHLMLPSSIITTTIIIDDEAEDLIVPEVTNCFEHINPPNAAQSEAYRYLEPPSSINRTHGVEFP